MDDKIFIPIEHSGQMAQIVPVVAELMKSGGKVVFLMNGPEGRWGGLVARLTAIQAGDMSMLDCAKAEWRRDVDDMQARAENVLRDTMKSVPNLNAEVKIYTGGLKQALAGLSREDAGQILLLPRKPSELRFRIARILLGLSRLGRRSAAFLLIHPEKAGARAGKPVEPLPPAEAWSGANA